MGDPDLKRQLSLTIEDLRFAENLVRQVGRTMLVPLHLMTEPSWFLSHETVRVVKKDSPTLGTLIGGSNSWGLSYAALIPARVGPK